MSDKSKKKQPKKTLEEDKPTTANAALSDLATLTNPVDTQAMMAQIDAQIKESEQVISQSLATTFSLLSQAADHLGQTAQPASQQNQETADTTAQHTSQSDQAEQHQQAMQTAEQQVATTINLSTNSAAVEHAINTATQGNQQAEDMIHQGIQSSDHAISDAIHQQQETLTQLHADSEKSVVDAVSGTAQQPADEAQQSPS